MFDGIKDFFWSIFYGIDVLLCQVVQWMYQMFAVFSGTAEVTYKGESATLINVFFNETAVHKIYWGMAIIGVVMIFAFTIIAVIRKMFDLGEKVKASLGEILGNAFKGILMILLMNFFVSVTFSFAAVLLQQVEYSFQNGGDLTDTTDITFGAGDLATMARVLDTVGNYSLNPSYNSRYNVNACFNEIREDMVSLQENGVFRISYPANGQENFTYTSWQYVLQQIAYSADLSKDKSLEAYDQQLSAAIIGAMDTIRNDKSLKPMSYYAKNSTVMNSSADSTRMDALLFLSGTLDAAKNDYFNENASVNDGLRGAYMRDEKDMYDWDTVKEDFDSGDIHYLITMMLAVMVGYAFLGVILNSVARIFNLMMLYLVAPPLIATLPLDDGEKFKQWMNAFIIQTFSIFGSIITIRLLIITVPILFSSDLVLLDDSILNIIAKLICLVGVAFTAEKAQEILTGILSGNGAGAASAAGNIGGAFTAKGGMMAAASVGWGAAKLGAKGAGKVGKALLKTTAPGRAVLRGARQLNNLRKMAFGNNKQRREALEAMGYGGYGGYGGGVGGYGGYGDYGAGAGYGTGGGFVGPASSMPPAQGPVPQVPNIPAAPGPVPQVPDIPATPGPVPKVPDIPATPGPVPKVPNLNQTLPRSK